MEWFKLATKLPRDPKWRALSPRAKVLYIEWACEIAEQESDGVVIVIGKAPAPVAELLQQGLAEPAEGGFYMPAFLKRNPSHADMERKRADARERAAKRSQIVRANDAETSLAEERRGELEVLQDLNLPMAQEQTDDKPTKTEAAALAEILLMGDSRAQYLLNRLKEHDKRWLKLTNGALIRLGKHYGADVVVTALGFMREEEAIPMDPYPYLEAVCVRVQAERESA